MCLSRRVLVVQCVSNCNICTCVCSVFDCLYIYIHISGFLKVYVSYVSQSNFCQLFFCEKNPIIGRYGLQPSQVGWGSCERKTGSFTSPRSCCKKKRNRNKWEKQTSIDTNTESQSRHSHCVLAGFYLRWAMAKHGQAELRKKLTTLATWLLLEIG